VASSEPQLSEVARQAGANPITLPSDNPGTAPSGTLVSGEISPTGVCEFSLYPSWTDAKDTPSWYAKGSDVDALLDVADTLDWLTDTGDIHESYQPTSTTMIVTNAPTMIESSTTGLVQQMSVVSEDMEDTHHTNISTHNHNRHGLYTHAQTPSVNNMSLSTLTLPKVDSEADVVVPPLPSLFDGGADDDDDVGVDVGEVSHHKSMSLSHHHHSSATIDEHLHVFDTVGEEHDFVSTILENSHESSGSLPMLS
jgi:hypothetical protein